MRRRPLTRMLLALLVIPLLSGCWNKMEIEEGAYALAIGIDRGEELPYSVTVQIAKPGAIAGQEGGGGEEKPAVLSTVEAPSLSSALSMLNGFTGRMVNLHHVRAVFVHEELAREDGLNFLDELVRFRQSRQTMFFIVTREKASEFLEEIDAKLAKNPMRYIEELAYNYRRNAMMPAEGQLNAIISRLDVAYAEPLSYYAALVDEEEKRESESVSAQAEAGFKAGELPRKGGSNVEMIGAAAFRQQRMVGVLTGDEVRHLLILQDQFRQAFVSVHDPKMPERYISVQLSRSRPFQFHADLSGPRPRLYGLVSLEAEILGVQSGIDYSEPELQALLETSIARQVREPIDRLIEKTQRWEADVVGFGRHLVSQFPTVDAWEQYRWPEKYPDAEFNITIDVRLRRFGLTLSPVEPVD
ncbi:MAG: Ger(x)C family spore germination protein [Bacillota bacterium]